MIALFISSTLFGLVAYAVYFQDTRKSTIKPNRWSWLIWSTTTLVEVLTFNAVSEDPITSAVFFVSVVACVVVTYLIWRRSEWKRPNITEILCLFASIVALFVWLVFKQAWWGHLIMVAAVPISFIPTYRDAWNEWRDEDSPAWMLWTIGDILALLFVLSRLRTTEEIPYAAVEAISHAAVWWIVSWKARSRPQRIMKAIEFMSCVLVMICSALMGLTTVSVGIIISLDQGIIWPGLIGLTIFSWSAWAVNKTLKETRDLITPRRI